MSAPDTLVELCAGMAAVSCRAVWGGDPPVNYQGGKRAYAGTVLSALGIVWPPSRVVLVEADANVAAGLWGIWTPEGRDYCIRRIESWASTDEAEHRRRWDWHLAHHRWNRWADLPREERAARWLWQRTRSAGSGVAAAWWMPRRKAKTGSPNWTPSRPAERLRRIPPGVRAEVIHADARAVDPIPGAVVYIDPPYASTTGYACDLPREDVLAIAGRWRRAGCRVVVSEAEPMPGADEHREAPYRGGSGRNNYSSQRREVVSIWNAA